MNLYLLTTSGLGDFYVAAGSAGKAEEALGRILKYEDRGFRFDRTVTHIRLLASTEENSTCRLIYPEP